MKIFKVNKNISIVCNSENTRYGFRHLATLIYQNREVDQAKCCYYNRTWERYEFESVLEKLAEKTTSISEKEKKLLGKFIKNESRVEDDLKPLKSIAMVASLGNIFSDSKKLSNDWKLRMIKAGLENKGLIMPEDWETLSEDEKEKRLNGVIDQLK